MAHLVPDVSETKLTIMFVHEDMGLTLSLLYGRFKQPAMRFSVEGDSFGGDSLLTGFVSLAKSVK